MSAAPAAARAVLLDRLATKIFGDEWAGPLSVWTGLNRRTLQRIRNAGRANEEHPSADGALAALSEAIDEIAAALSAAKF